MPSRGMEWLPVKAWKHCPVLPLQRLPSSLPPRLKLSGAGSLTAPLHPRSASHHPGSSSPGCLQLLGPEYHQADTGQNSSAVSCSSVSAQRNLQCQGLWTGRLDSWLPQPLPQKQEVILCGETGPLPPQDLRVWGPDCGLTFPCGRRV